MMIRSVAVVEWVPGDGLSQNFNRTLLDLGIRSTLYRPGTEIPESVDLIFSHGPYGSLFSILNPLHKLPKETRPRFYHWDIEGVPDLHIPKVAALPLGLLRSRIEKLKDSDQKFKQKLAKSAPLLWVGRRFGRMRNFGDYYQVNKLGLFDVLFDYSVIYTRYHRKFGIPAQYLPWGTCLYDYADLNLERDIDILWMGQRHGKRRTQLVDQIRSQVEQRGYKMMVVDGVEHPFIFNEERTRFLNRSKITLNLLPYWDFNNFPFKFHLAAGNRSLVVTETFLKHNPEYTPGYHYIETPVKQIVETLVYYLNHKQERESIVENAYRFATMEMTLSNSLCKVLRSDCTLV